MCLRYGVDWIQLARVRILLLPFVSMKLTSASQKAGVDLLATGDVYKKWAFGQFLILYSGGFISIMKLCCLLVT
jgi:hypothetical protein